MVKNNWSEHNPHHFVQITKKLTADHLYWQTVKQHIFLKESYELATKLLSGHLLIDLDLNTSDSLRYCSNILQPGPTIVCLPSSKADITNLTAERDLSMLKQKLELCESIFRKFPKEAPNSLINFLCECLLNVFNGNVPVNKQLLKHQEDSIQ